MKQLFGQWTICVSERWTGERSETSLQRGGKAGRETGARWIGVSSGSGMFKYPEVLD